MPDKKFISDLRDFRLHATEAIRLADRIIDQYAKPAKKKTGVSDADLNKAVMGLRKKIKTV